ncbi:MAG: ABC transporter ATP-binding protein [Brevinema sp.]
MTAIKMNNITKKFGSLIANDNISFQIEEGDIFAIIGENGAGKTTLMNILFSILPCDSGSIEIFEKPVEFHSPKDAIAGGLGMVHQHFKLVPSLSVAQNIFLGYEIEKNGFIDYESQVQKVRELSQEFGLEIDPHAIVGHLPVGMQQRVEILKVLLRGAKILILDEPTAVLTPQEATDLFSSLRHLNKEKNLTIIFISHHIQEIFEFSQHILVLRNGKNVAVKDTKSVNMKEIAELIIGKPYVRTQNNEAVTPGKVALDIQNLYVRNHTGRPVLKNININVREGEIVGIAGVAGNGQDELVHAICGIQQPSYGKILLNSEDITQKSTWEIRKRGISHIPGDRMHNAIDPLETIYFNMMLGKEDNPEFCSHGIFNHKAFQKTANGWIDKFSVKCASGHEKITSLSGGNIQKTVIAREFTNKSNVFLIDQPTQGVDIGSSNTIYEELLQCRKNKNAVLLISMQLDEILSLCDRIYVIFEGRIMGEVDPKKITEQEIGLMMTGVGE